MNWMTTAKRRLKQNSGNKFNSKANDMNNLRNNQTKTKTQNQNHNHNNNQNQQPKLNISSRNEEDTIRNNTFKKTRTGSSDGKYQV